MKENIYVLDLFSGIGGFTLAAEIANAMADTGLFGQEKHEKQTTGIEQRSQGTRFVGIAHAEVEPFACAVYHRNFPDSVCFGGVENVTRDSLLERCGVLPDVVCGGFPCQPHSCAGKRLASADDRDLWGECRRILRDVRPRFALFENVRGLLSSESGLFFNKVLSEMAEIRYACQWQIVPAKSVGAPHKRDRVWMLCWDELSNTTSKRCEEERGDFKRPEKRTAGDGAELQWPALSGQWPSRPGEAQHGWEPPRVVADSMQQGGCKRRGSGRNRRREWSEENVGTATRTGDDAGDDKRQTEPALGVLPDGLPAVMGGTGDEVCKAEDWPTPSVCGNHNRKGVSPTSGDGLATKVSMSMRTQVRSERLREQHRDMPKMREHVAGHSGHDGGESERIGPEVLWHTPSAEEAGARVETLYTKDGQPARPGERAYRLQPDGRLVLQSVTINQQVNMVGGSHEQGDWPEVHNRTAQLKAAGNSIVPEVASIFMHAILKIYQREFENE